MQQIGAFEAKNTLGTLLDRVQGGEEIVITRHGRPAARLVPYTVGVDRAKAVAALERMRRRARKAGLGRFDWKAVRQDRDRGRP